MKRESSYGQRDLRWIARGSAKRQTIVLWCTLSLFGCASTPDSVAKMPQQRGYADYGQLTTLEVQAIEAFCGPGQPGDICPGAKVPRIED